MESSLSNNFTFTLRLLNSHKFIRTNSIFNVLFIFGVGEYRGGG